MLRVSEPSIGREEIDAVSDALNRVSISGHVQDYIAKFEADFAAYCNVAHGIATNNGTTSIHLMLAALGIAQGDEILVSTYTNMATFFAVLYQGAVPVPIDIEPDTFNMNPDLLERSITPRTKAILAVHIFGHPVDMEPVNEIAKRYGLFVLEDAAQSHGALYKSRKTGSLSDAASFSFYANKIITTGEGGMVVTNNDRTAAACREYRNLCYGRGEDRFMHEDIGFNYRMSNLHAAIGWAQVQKLEENVQRKRKMAGWYSERLKGHPALQLPIERAFARNVYWMYHVLLTDKCKVDRTTVVARLHEQGIETRPGFTPFNLQKFAHAKRLARAEDCPIANRVGRNAFYLPSGLLLGEEQADMVATALLRSIEP